MTTDAAGTRAGGDGAGVAGGRGSEAAGQRGTGSGGVPRILADTGALGEGAGDARGAVWRLAEEERHLDANVIALPPGEAIDAHIGPDEDVLWHVLAGDGALSTDDGSLELRPGAIVWLPRRSRRSVTAGPDGLRYLSVHRRKGGLQIGGAPPSSAG